MVLFLLVVPAAAPARPAPVRGVEVVVTLAQPPLAEHAARSLAGRRGGRLDLRSEQSVSYLRTLAAAQRSLAERIAHAIPGAAVRWNYSVVVDGMAVVVPPAAVPRLSHVPGVAHVWPNVTYHALDDRSTPLVGAPTVWGPGLATAGQGMKIGIIDDGVDQSHPFFDPAGYAYPPGFPKGDTRYTTPKVIVARAFVPAGTTYANATLPFDPQQSDHATHVAGIAAGDENTNADGVRISGVAPRAYIGNYKALAIPTPDFGLDGNAPELVAAVEAAVTDGMDVINLSLGEPEIEPSRDILAHALDAAADAGVVPVVAAGNEFTDFGHGSIGSPGSAAKAISAAASSGGHGSRTVNRIADFSSGGPTPYSLQFKPDVTAPGELVLSSVPAHEGFWDQFSGTSMATPHVAGGAALLRQRHPAWTVAQIKSALALTGVPVRGGNGEVPATREGGGRMDLVRADDPLVFAAPTSLSFGLLRSGASRSRAVSLTDADGGAGAWTLRIQLQGSAHGVTVAVPSSVTVPGTFAVHVRVGRAAAERDVTGFVVLTHAGTSRRLPFWFRVERPKLGLDRALPLTRQGTYRGTTVGAPSRVADYRYPDLHPTSASIPVRLPGPEVVYRFRLTHPVANFGVVLTQRTAVQPRIVLGADENRLAGYEALPLDENPYRSSFGERRPVVGALAPAPGVYEIVFDSPADARPGPFSFRFWIGDTTPPSIRLLSVRNRVVTLAVRDGGSGVDPVSLRALVDGHAHPVKYADGLARVTLFGVRPGPHELVFRAADYQETKNMESYGGILPNTRTLRTSFDLP